MSLADFLGQIGTALQGSNAMPAGIPMANQAPGGGLLALPGNDQSWLHGTNIGQAPPPQPVEQPRRRGGVGDFLGKLGDALLIGTGHEPIYGKHQEQQQLGEHLAAYLGVGDQGLAQLFKDDPGTAFEIWKSHQPKPGEGFTLGAGQVRYGPDGHEIARGPADSPNSPAFVNEMQALGIDPHSPEALELFYAKNSPAGYLLKPRGGGPAAQPAGGAEPPAAAINHLKQNPNLAAQFDQKYGAGSASRVLGGGGGNSTGGFPGR